MYTALSMHCTRQSKSSQRRLEHLNPKKPNRIRTLPHRNAPLRPPLDQPPHVPDRQVLVVLANPVEDLALERLPQLHGPASRHPADVVAGERAEGSVLLGAEGVDHRVADGEGGRRGGVGGHGGDVEGADFGGDARVDADVPLGMNWRNVSMVLRRTPLAGGVLPHNLPAIASAST